SDPGPRPYVLAAIRFMAIQEVTHTTALSSWQATGFTSDRPGGPAGDLEIPMMMHLGPESVLPVGAGDGLAQALKIPGLGEGKCPAQRKRTQVSGIPGLGVLGGLGGMLSVIIILVLMDAPQELIRSLAPKSVTTPIAIEISKSISGEPNITAGIVIAVGVLGSTLGIFVLRALGIRSMTAMGTALGTAAHGIGTARALEENRLAGAYGGMALCVNGLFTAVVLPIIINWF